MRINKSDLRAAKIVSTRPAVTSPIQTSKPGGGAIVVIGFLCFALGLLLPVLGFLSVVLAIVGIVIGRITSGIILLVLGVLMLTINGALSAVLFLAR